MVPGLWQCRAVAAERRELVSTGMVAEAVGPSSLKLYGLPVHPCLENLAAEDLATKYQIYTEGVGFLEATRGRDPGADQWRSFH